jgi:hypothetical protein
LLADVSYEQMALEFAVAAKLLPLKLQYMSSSDYTASSGALKLKGAAGITKQMKKKTSKPKPEDESAEPVYSEIEVVGRREESKKSLETLTEDVIDVMEKETVGGVKTEAQLRFDENKRKRISRRSRS